MRNKTGHDVLLRPEGARAWLLWVVLTNTHNDSTRVPYPFHAAAKESQLISFLNSIECSNFQVILSEIDF